MTQHHHARSAERFRRSPRHRILVAGASAAALTIAWTAFGASAAQAQTDGKAAADGSPGLEEVVVTASKREAESALKVPGAIQAISGDSLQRMGASGFIDIAGKVPGLQLEDLGPGDKRYVIRGITSTGASTTGVYYDEAVISGNNANDGGGRQADIRLYDLQRIEVLRGPQGTLFGAGSESGTIRFITRKPELSGIDGYVTGEVSGTSKGGTNYDINGAVNLPVVEGKLAARVVGWSVNDSGYIDQVRVPSGRIDDVNNDDTSGGRVELLFDPTESLSILASVTVQKTESKGSSRFTPPGALSFGDTAAGFPPVAGGDLVNTDLTRSPWREHLTVYSLTASYTMKYGTLTGTTNWFTRHIGFNFDSSPILFFFGVPVPAETIEPQGQRVVSSEIRYASDFSGPVNFVVGAFREEETTDFTVNVVRTNNLGLPAGPFSMLNADDALLNPATGNTFFGRIDNRATLSYAGFGDITWNVTPAFSLEGGLRYFAEGLDGVQETTHPFGGFGPSPVGAQTNHARFVRTTYKFNASYKFAPDQLAYFTASEGFRSGGLNAANLPFASNIPRGFGPDSLWNYEIGSKGKLFDGRIAYDLDAFLIDWNSIQVSTVDPTGAFPFIVNAGGAQVKGVEAQLMTRLLDNLTVDLGASYQYAALTDDEPPDPGNPNRALKGDRLAHVPLFEGNLSVEYTVPIDSTFSGTLAADINYRGSSNTQAHAGSPFNTHLADYALVNLRAAISSGEWTATLFLRNATDERAQIDAISSDQDPLARITVRPRTVGITVTRAF